MKSKIIIVSLILLSCESSPIENKSEKTKKSIKKEQLITSYNNGKSVYNKHCNNCHALYKKDGANWSNLFSGIKNNEHTVINFIVSSSRLRLDSNEFAIRIKKEYNNTNYEHEFKNILSETQLSELILFLKVKSNQ